VTASQPSLFDTPAREFGNKAPLAARNDPSTSHQAAERFTASGARANQKRAFLEWMRANPRARTSAEIARDGPFPRDAVARRLPDLERDGLVERLPARECAARGGQAITWRAL
jgi:hypothetical protein